TWVDRSEAAVLRKVCPHALVSAVYGHTAEHFSATPLLAAAAVLLGGGRLPRTLMDRWRGVRGVRAAGGDERVDHFAVLCTDFSGAVSGAVFAASPPPVHL